MVEPVAGAPAWTKTAPVEPPQLPGEPEPSPEVLALHRSFWRYLIGEGEERAGSGEDRRRWPAEPAPTAAETAALFATVAEGPADGDRVAAAYSLGRSQSQAAVEALLQLFVHATESARRAATYGLTVGGELAAQAMLAMLAEPPLLPPREPPLADNIDEQAALLPQVAHVLSQLAAHAVSTHAVAVLATAMRRAKAEIETFASGVREIPTDPAADYEYYVIERRRTMV